MGLDPTWLGCDLVTGQIIDELPELVPQGSIGRLLGDYTSATFTLPLPGPGSLGAPVANWRAATQPGRAMIVCVLGQVPVWAGTVLTRKSGSAASTQLACATLEAYLKRRYISNHTWTGQDEASVIAAGLIGDANTTEGIGLVVDAPPTGRLRDRTYLDTDDKTAYSALQELSGVIDGPEWTIDLWWTSAAHTAISKTFVVRSRIGFPAPPTGPVSIFETTGLSELIYEHTEDWSEGSGANDVLASSSGEGDLRPQSAHWQDAVALAGGWPRYEYRFTPSTSIVDTAVLDAHAEATLAVLARGAEAYTFTARADAPPLLGQTWQLGDDIGWVARGPADPAGITDTGRVLGWNLDLAKSLVSPIVLTTA